MDRLEAMQIFVWAVDEGSLAAAARRMGRSAAAATRAVAMLEAMTDETLLLRSTRGLRLTPPGERKLAVWREVLERLHEADHEPASPRIVSGSMVLTAPELFGRLKVLPIVETFLEQHPHVQARLLLLNRVVDMVAEGVDLAVRLAHLDSSSLIAVKLGEVRQLVCASPAYLAAHKAPLTPADLAEHACIGMTPQSDQELWSFRREAGGSRPRSVRVTTSLAMNSAAASLESALRGRGVARQLSYQVADDIAAGRLQVLLPQFEPEPVPVNLVFRTAPRAGSPLRHFIDYSVPALRRELTRVVESISTA